MPTQQSSQTIIEARDIGKKYRITHERGRYIALRDVITNVLKAPFSFIKSKTKRAVGLETKEEFWALKNINFSVNRGEIIGIIGRNGAGKSTLLKILSQITPPTTGEIRIAGKISSLLEVGTGFHPELTGRENIFLNGAILGMTRSQISKKFDEIVAFSGIEKFLDTPVKHFSSGMSVRLAFSIAAHVEPDILIIDEVLSVGDRDFQKKCLGKMDSLTKESNRTILIVSHDMSIVRSLCKKTILIEKGSIQRIGPTDEVIQEYLQTMKKEREIEPKEAGSLELQLQKIVFRNNEDHPWIIQYKEDLRMDIAFTVKMPIRAFRFGIGINTIGGERIVTAHSEEMTLSTGKYSIEIKIQNLLTPGNYDLNLGVLNIYHLPSFTTLQVENNGNDTNTHKWYNDGLIAVQSEFIIKKHPNEESEENHRHDHDK